MTLPNTNLGHLKFERSKHDPKHDWVTVVNPMNHRLLLQACDNCGVVKSENSVVRRCKAPKGNELISSALRDQQPLAV